MAKVSTTNRVNRYRASAWKKFRESVEKSSSQEDLLNRLSAFLTQTEILMIEKRLIALNLLEQGTGCREIGRSIDLSPNTVTFVKHNFKRKHKPKKIPKHIKKYVKYHHSSKGAGAAFWRHGII